MLIVTVHLGGIALLNFESARHAWHEKELRRLQQQNEQLRAQLNMLTSEPEVRRWAEAQGMVRAESQNALIVPVSIANRQPSGTLQSQVNLPLARQDGRE